MDVFAELSKAIEHLACAVEQYAATQWPIYTAPKEVEPWWNLPVTYTPTPDGTVMHLGPQVIESGLSTENMTRLPG